MIRTLLLVLAIVLFALLALHVITTDLFRWEMAAFAVFAASFLPFLPFPEITTRRP